MSLSDQDWEQLGALLDDELSLDEAEALRRRMDVQPELDGALDVLRADRAMRVAAIESLAPTSAHAEAFADRALRIAKREARKASLWERVAAQTRVAAAAAALVLIGFGVGWLGRGHDGSIPNSFEPSRNVGSVTNAAAPAQVNVRDERGRVIASQPFTDPRQAEEFMNDMRRWRQQQQQLRDANIVYKADQF